MGVIVTPRERPAGSTDGALPARRWSARGEQAFILLLGSVQVVWIAVLGYTLVRLLGAA